MKKYQVIPPFADIHGTPEAAALRGKFETQLVLGEAFIVTEEKDGWCKGTCAHDGYAGYIDSRHLTHTAPAPTHIVIAARSHAYQDATIKSPLVQTLSFGSLVAVAAEDRDFAQIGGGSWLSQKHLAPLNGTDKDYVATALKFLETPYYWGGRSGFGIDCSGLVQVCLMRAGIKAPRETEDQEMVLGQPSDKPQAGDLVFFPGHVGIMADERSLIHANAFHMKVTVEPLDDVAARSKGITSVRRLV